MPMKNPATLPSHVRTRFHYARELRTPVSRVLIATEDAKSIGIGARAKWGTR